MAAAEGFMCAAERVVLSMSCRKPAWNGDSAGRCSRLAVCASPKLTDKPERVDAEANLSRVASERHTATTTGRAGRRRVWWISCWYAIVSTPPSPSPSSPFLLPPVAAS